MADKVEYVNPIVPGFSPDPSVVHVDGVFYLANSSFHMYPGIPIYASTDLRQWTQIGNAINRPEQLSLKLAKTDKFPLDTGHYMVAGGGLFAPSIRYHKGTFYVICTNTLMEDPYATKNFIVSTTDIWGGAWSDPDYVDFEGIDPSIFFDDDDRAYFQGCFTIDRTKQPSCTLKQFEIDVKTGKTLSEVREIWGGHAKYDTEGPHVYKRGKWYYLIAAEGGTFEHHMLCIGRSESIWGPYEDYETNPILTADGKPEYIQNLGHGELFEDAAGQWWAAALGVRDVDGVWGLGRETFLTSVDWPEGGWPKILQPKMNFTGPVVPTPSSEASKRFAYFTPPSDVDLLYIRDPDLSKYSLTTGSSGELTLSPSLSTFANPEGTSTFIGKRQRSLDSTVTVSVNLSEKNVGIKAGLAVYKDALRNSSLIYDFDAGTVTHRTVNDVSSVDQVSPVKLRLESTEQLLQLKIVSTATEYRFFARAGKKDAPWVEVGTLECLGFTVREMTGPIFGLFAHTTSEEQEKSNVVFSDFKVVEK